MASLAIGMAGGFIGNLILPGIGGSIGFALGNALGNALFPAKQAGPRLTDLRLQNSEYGQMRPFCFGTVRIGGQVIFQTDLEEHRQRGGKGGGPDTYTYSASYAIRLCEGPILGIAEIWADNRLVWDGTQSYEDFPMTIYLGTEDQLPDPTMEAVLGEGNVNANRGVAYAVWKDHDLSDFFNRLPNYTFKINASGGARFQRISTWDVPTLPFQPGIGTIPVAGWFFDDGVLTWGSWTPGGAGPNILYQEFTYDVNTGTELHIGDPIDTGLPYDILYSCSNYGICIAKLNGSGDSNVTMWGYRGYFHGDPIQPPTSSGRDYYIYAPWKHEDFVYAAGGRPLNSEFYIGKWGIVDADGITRVNPTPEVEYLDLWAMGYHGAGGANDADNCAITSDENGTLWVAVKTGTNATDLIEVDNQTMTVRSVQVGPPGLSPSASALCTFTVFRGHITVSNVTNDMALLYRMDGGGNYTQVDAIVCDTSTTAGAPFVSLEGGYIIVHDGILYIKAQEILANIVGYFCRLTGLAPDQYDVTELVPPVDGYTVASQGTARAAIEPLQPAFMFDPVESDAKIKWRLRPQQVIDVIPSTDLGTRQSGADLIAQIARKRIEELSLPKRASVNYLNEEADYQQGNAQALRIVTTSQIEWTFSLPIAMTKAKAIAAANTILYVAYMERTKIEFATPMKWCWIDPNDVVTLADAGAVRITDRTITLDGLVKF